MNYNELSTMSGESSNRKPADVKYNQIKFNGKTGEFMKINILKEKGEDNKYETENLGKSLSVIFLKHRRTLSQFVRNGDSKQTTEHNSKDDYVTLFIGKTREQGRASELRERHTGLRTHQIIYCYVPSLKEVCKLEVKGASLGSESKPEGVLGYYEYLATYKGDEHSFQFITELTPVEEQSPMGSYYAINFKKGIALNEEQMSKVADMIKEIHTKIVDLDNYNLSKIPNNIIKSDAEIEQARKDDYIKERDALNSRAVKEEPVVQLDEINPEDIPF